MRAHLVAAGYVNGYVTVDNYDWYLDRLFQKAIAREQPKTLLLGQGRVVALAVDGGFTGRKGIWEDEEEIRAELDRRGVFKR